MMYYQPQGYQLEVQSMSQTATSALFSLVRQKASFSQTTIHDCTPESGTRIAYALIIKSTISGKRRMQSSRDDSRQRARVCVGIRGGNEENTRARILIS